MYTKIGYTHALTGWHEAIMLQNLSIMLLSNAPKITYYVFKKSFLIPKIMPDLFCKARSIYTLLEQSVGLSN